MTGILDRYFSNKLLDNISDLLIPYNLKLLHSKEDKFIKIYFKPRHWKEEDAPCVLKFNRCDAIKMLCDWNTTRTVILNVIKEFQKDYRY